jgi:hypothetical protein
MFRKSTANLQLGPLNSFRIGTSRAFNRIPGQLEVKRNRLEEDNECQATNLNKKEESGSNERSKECL